MAIQKSVLVRSLVFVALAVTDAPSEPASYRRLPLHELIGLAERVVVGQIEEVEEKTYRLRVDQVLFGQAAPHLQVRRFQDWTCAGRWSAYEKGQRVLLFMRGNRALGAGNEGDMPVQQGGALAGYRIKGSRYVERWASAPVPSSWVELDEWKEAICFLRGAFRFRLSEKDWTCEIDQIATAEELGQFRSSSGIARTLIEEMERGLQFAYAEEKQERPTALPGEESSRRTRLLDLGRGEEGDLGAHMAVIRDDNSSTGVRLLVSGTAQVVLLETGGAIGNPRIERIPRPDDGSFFSKHQPFGRALVEAGDVDGNGTTDILIGNLSQRAGFHGGGPHETSLWLFYRGPGSPDAPLAIPSLEGREEHIDSCQFGRTLAHLGDLDGDGVDEIVIGATRDLELAWRDPVPLAGEGSITLATPTAQGMRFQSTIPASAFGASGPARGLSFATSLAGIGDLDYDGVPDLAIGDPHDHEAGPYAGAVWIAFLHSDGTLRSTSRIDSAELGLRANNEFGASLSAIGDVNFDGVPDLLVGGANELWVLLLAENADVHKVHRYEADSLLPRCVELRDIASPFDATHARAEVAFVSGFFSKAGRNSRIHALSIRPDGSLTAENER